jgi:hypothetical protein
MRLSTLFAMAVIATSIAGQRPGSWVPLAIPGGPLPSAITQLGKLIAYQEPSRVSVFSAFTRTWHEHRTNPGATILNANDWVLIVDGRDYTAFSSTLGRFVTVPLSPAARVLNPASQRNDSILLVQDGTTIWAFSGFVGVWIPLRVSAVAVAAVQRYAAIIVDGTTLWGLGASDDRFAPHRADGLVTSVWADGVAAVAETAGSIHAYSAQMGRWASHPALGGPVQVQRLNDVVVWNDGRVSLGYSGPRGRFATSTTGAAAAILVDRDLALVQTPGRLFAFSAPRAEWGSFAIGPSVTIQTSWFAALVQDGNTVTAYSAMTGATASLPFAAGATDITGSMVAVLESGTGKPWLFSAITSAWYPLPADAVPTLPRLALQSALVASVSGGYYGYSARHGRFEPAVVTGATQPHVDSGSSILAVTDANSLHVFDARSSRWRSAGLTAAVAPTVGIWRTTLVAIDGTTALGYGSQSGEIESAPILGSLLATRASSESARLETSTHLIAFSPVPELAGEAQYPEFRRLQPLGARLQLRLAPNERRGAFAVLGRLAAQSIPIAGLGNLSVDPASWIVFSPRPNEVDSSLVVDLTLPDLSALSGLELFAQALVSPPVGQPYLSRLASAMIF